MGWLRGCCLALFLFLGHEGAVHAQGKSAVTTTHVDFTLISGRPDYIDLRNVTAHAASVTSSVSQRNLKSYVITYKAWGQMGEFAYAPAFYYETDDVLYGKRKVDYGVISKYPDLADRFRKIRPSSVNFVIAADLRMKGRMMPMPVLFKVTDSDLVYFESRSPRNYKVPTSPPRWKDRFTTPSSHAFTPADRVEDKELRGYFRDLESATPAQYSNVQLDITWPEDAIDQIARDYDEYEKKNKPIEEQAKKLRDDYVPPMPSSSAATGGPQAPWDTPAPTNVTLKLDRDYDNTTTTNGVLTLTGKIEAPLRIREQAKLVAEGYEQKVAVDQGGRFNQHVVLRSGANKIVLRAGPRRIEQRVTLDREATRLRVTLTWDGKADIDLHVFNSQHEMCSFRNKWIGGMRLDVDNTSAYGPENIYVEEPQGSSYYIEVENYSGGVGITATVHIFVDEKLHSVKRVRFEQDKQIEKLAKVDI